MKKSTLTKKILCSVLAASAFGFYYADNAFAATVNNDKHLITNENLAAEVGSCKLIVGQGKLDIQTNGSVGTVLANFAQGKDLLSALAPTTKPDGTIVYAPLVGVVGGEGKMDKNTLDNLVFAKTMLPFVDENLANKLTPIIDKVANINTLDKKVDNNVIGSADKKADINVNIGGENSEPVVMGAVGGDFSFNANLATKDTTGATDPNSIERFGDVNMNINSGNVLGGVGGSAAVAVGNINAKVNLGKLLSLDYVTNGNTKTTINGDVNTNVKDAANLAAWMNGGAAVAIGGKAESVVNGTSNVVINSKVNGGELEGLTAGVAGGGLAVSTLGSTATSTVNGDTNISVKNGLAAGLVGGGMAGSVDATWVGSKLMGDAVGNNGNFTDITDEQLEKLLGMQGGIPDSTIVLNGVYDGGTATATTKDTHINLTGTTTAAGVIGGGVAGALHDFVARGDEHGTRPEGVQQGEVLGSSEAVANTGKTYINVNVANKNGKPLTSEEKGELIQGLKDIKAAAKELANKNSDAVIGKLESAATNLADKGAVMGVVGGGVAIGYSGNNASLAKDSKGAVATATNAGAEINLNSGYVVGALGGGMALSNRNAHAEAVTTDDINVNLNGAEVIGVFGNGFAGAKDGIHNSQQKDSGYAKTTATNTNININAGSADGVFGGGLAVTTGKNHTETSKVDTTGTSTINVAAKVDTLKYENLNSVFDDGMMHDMFGAQFDAVKKEAKDVAIFGGGVAAGQGAVSHVKDSVININSGAEITGDVVAGGLAVVDGKSTVDNSVINWNGGSISGVLNGSGIGSKSTVDNSVLNINGDVELNAVAKDGKEVSKITQFNKVTFKAGTETTVSGLKAGNTTALIDGRDYIINVEDGARLNITKLDKADDAYLIASGYNDKSTLWENKDLAYDRTESYASATNKEGKYTVTYKDLGNLTDAESEQAIHDFVGSLGEHGGALEGIVEGIVNNGDKTNAGAKDFFGDITSSDKLNETALAAGTLFGEAAGVTSTTAAVAKDMAENATLRLSFTQDTVNADPIDENGAVWAKYLHNKHKVDGMDSSVGALNSESSYDGVTVGYDLAKHGNMQTGIAFSYVDGDGNGLGVDNDFDMWGLNIYGNIKQDDVNFIADLGYSKGSHDLSGTINGKAMTADRDLSVLSAGIRAEKLYINGNTQIVPYAGLRYMSIDSDDYTTYYGGKAAFENSADTQNVWTMPIGVSLRNETATASGWRITPQVDLAYVWAFGDTDNDVTVNAGSGASVLNYDVMDSGSWVGSLAVEAAKDDWSFGVGYSYQKGSDAQDNKWFANVNYSF